MQQHIDNILSYWLGQLDEDGMSPADRQALWFSKNEATDTSLRTRYGKLLERALAGELEHWAASDDGLVALVILLDQFSRNIHRGTPKSFAGDAMALALARAAIADKRHLDMPAIHRVFLYMPLEHSEDLALQRQCVSLFTTLADSVGPAVEQFVRYAHAHCEVIAQFGRFPHRNAILSRDSTEAELTYLERHGGF